MKTKSRLWLLATQVLVVMSTLLVFWQSTSFADQVRLITDESVSGDGWDDPNYGNLYNTTPDGNIVQVTSVDQGKEQMYGFQKRTGVQVPWCPSVSVRIYGKKIGNPSPLQVRICLAGCWISTTKTVTMTTSYAAYTVTWTVASGTPDWTSNQFNKLRVGIEAPLFNSDSESYCIDYIYVNGGENEDEWYDGVLDWGFDRSLGSAEASFVGARQNEYAGTTVSGFGDVDGDGIVDFGIGACNTALVPRNRVYLVHGVSNMSDSYSLSNNTYFEDPRWEYGGFQIANMGNITGDTKSDIMIGMPGWQLESGTLETGANSLFSGRSSWNSYYLTADDYTSIWTGTHYDEKAGSPVGLGDVNGDGYDDYAVGSPGFCYHYGDLDELTASGCVYLNFGPVFGSGSLDESDYILKVLAAGAQLGNRVRPIGDINDDGYHDFIASFTDNTLHSHCDSCRLYLGRSSANWGVSATFFSEAAGNLATFPTSIGDFNGDNIDDFAIAAPYYGSQGGATPGKVYIFFGEETGWSGAIDVSSADCSFVGNSYDGLGHYMAGAGDLDGDGYDDMLISGNDKVYVVCGKGRDFCNDIDDAYITDVADASITGFGNGTLAGIGNVNNDDDGYPDIAISNVLAASGWGTTYVFFGGRN